MTTTTYRLEGVNDLIRTFMDQISKTIIRSGVNEAAKTVEIQYRNRLQDIACKQGNSGIQAYLAVGHKTRVFRDGTGAYAVVGAIKQNGRMLAPQMRWGEVGTAKRETKFGANRGIMPAQRWLQLTLDATIPLASKALKARINYLVSRVGVS